MAFCVSFTPVPYLLFRIKKEKYGKTIILHQKSPRLTHWFKW